MGQVCLKLAPLGPNEAFAEDNHEGPASVQGLHYVVCNCESNLEKRLLSLVFCSCKPRKIYNQIGVDVVLHKKYTSNIIFL